MADPTLTFASLLTTLREQAMASHQRRVVVVAGGRAWCHEQAKKVLEHQAPANPGWIGDQAPDRVTPTPFQQARQLLGSERDGLVFDAHAGFDPDALGAVTGVVPGGGLFLLLTPPLTEWPDVTDPAAERIAVHPWQAKDISGRLLRHVAREIRADRHVTLIEEGHSLPTPPGPSTAPATEKPADPECATADQAETVRAILTVARGHRHRPLVISADRGRGKSAALGIAAARLMREGPCRIGVTAPRLAAAEAVFDHAARSLSEADRARGRVETDDARLEFLAPDELLATRPRLDLLLVDEAAAIPAQMLKPLLRRHPRVVFSSTIHGYEGTGRGFAVRFRQTLDRLTPDWRSRRLQAPIRWATNDPLENLTFRMLLLNAEPAPAAVAGQVAADECRIERLDRDALAEDRDLLGEVFALLVGAHYRTRPTDLRNLLDGPGVGIHVARDRGHVLGVGVTVREGGFSTDLARAVFRGERRPRGHLLPQTLAAHAGIPEAPTHECDRIMRLAVHPAIRQQGLGSRLVNAMVEDARDTGADLVGTSFGATPELLRFWEANQFTPVHLGLTRGHASGTHAVVLLKSLSDKGHSLHRLCRHRFRAGLPTMLAGPLRSLDPGLADRLLAPSANAPSLDEHDWQQIQAVAFAHHGPDNALPALQKLLLQTLETRDDRNALPAASRELLIARLFQHQDWSSIAHRHGLPGKKAALAELRQALQQILRILDKD